MNENLKSINELLNYDFFIPSYQRGYRWDDEQVVDLLDDIWDFYCISGKKEGEFYCLQPIIIKKENDAYRLIDGQQRLTTIYIILSYFDDVANILFSSNKKFNIEYETREDSKRFLENIRHITEIDDSNIDYYYMSKAFLRIGEWIEERGVNKADFLNTLIKSERNNKKKDVANNVRVIWYEVADDEIEIEVFTRINSGKIPLTNSELIKALFLNRNNFGRNDKAIKQIEISKEWDEIECALQNNEFWYFITKDKDYPARIELIFEIFANLKSRDKFTTYRYFAGKDSVVSLWSECDENIKKVFLSLKYWFENRRLYHLIGFLIAARAYDIKNIYQEFKGKTKSDFLLFLHSLIKNDLRLDDLDELEYGIDNDDIHKALLLFNLATILNNKESHVRFAFDKFNSEKWSLEHIHAQQDKGLQSSDARRTWINDAKKQIETLPDEENRKETLKDILIDINNILSQDKIPDEVFQEIQISIFYLFGNPNINTIDNLALLSNEVNSSLSNNIFPIKRSILISKDKDGEFIPICTKNVFLKYYSSNIDKMHYWSKQDRSDYLSEIKGVLNKFSGGSNV